MYDKNNIDDTPTVFGPLSLYYFYGIFKFNSGI